jgi:hypothetical protein
LPPAAAPPAPLPPAASAFAAPPPTNWSVVSVPNRYPCCGALAPVPDPGSECANCFRRRAAPPAAAPPNCKHAPFDEVCIECETTCAPDQRLCSDCIEEHEDEYEPCACCGARAVYHGLQDCDAGRCRVCCSDRDCSVCDDERQQLESGSSSSSSTGTSTGLCEHVTFDGCCTNCSAPADVNERMCDSCIDECEAVGLRTCICCKARGVHSDDDCGYGRCPACCYGDCEDCAPVCERCKNAPSLSLLEWGPFCFSCDVLGVALRKIPCPHNRKPYSPGCCRECFLKIKGLRAFLGADD